jgi:hypothetical protein
MTDANTMWNFPVQQPKFVSSLYFIIVDMQKMIMHSFKAHVLSAMSPNFTCLALLVRWFSVSKWNKKFHGNGVVLYSEKIIAIVVAHF